MHLLDLQIWNIVDNLRRNRTVKNGALFAFFSFLNSGFNFFLLILIADFIAPEGYGKLNLFTTFVTLFSFLLPLNSTGIIGAVFFRESIANVRKTINAVFLITGFVFFVFSLVVLFCAPILGDVVGISAIYQWIALWICFFQVCTTVNLDIWRLEEAPIKYGCYSFAMVLLNFVLTICFVVFLKYDWLGRIYAQFVVGGIFFIFSLLLLLKRGYLVALFPDKRIFLNVLAFGIPLIPHAVSFWLRQGLDRYIVNYFYDSTQVGLLSFSFNFANVIQILGTAFNATNSVFIYKNLAENTGIVRKKLHRQTILMLLFFVGVTIVVCLGANIFIPFLFPEYKGCVSFLYPQCLGAMFHCFYLLFVNYLFFYKKTKGLMYITFSFSVLHVFLSFVLTEYSMYYTLYIGLLSNILIALSVFLYSRRIYKVL